VRSAFVAVAVALAAVAAACSSGPALIDYPTPKVSAPTTSTTVFDYESVALPDVPGPTTTTVDNRPGKANLTGTVTGPDGPVPMANVRVERELQDAAWNRIFTNPKRTSRTGGGQQRARRCRDLVGRSRTRRSWSTRKSPRARTRIFRELGKVERPARFGAGRSRDGVDRGPRSDQEILKLRRRVQKLAALLRLSLALLRTSGFSLMGERLPDGRAKTRIRRAVDRAHEYLPVASDPAVPACVAESVPCLAQAAERRRRAVGADAPRRTR